MTDDWETHSRTVEFECPWFTVGVDEVETPAGDREDYYWIDRPQDALAVVAIDDAGVVMVEQYRPKLEQSFLECPGGHVEDGETYLEAAARELREETGVVADELTQLTTYYPTATTRYERAVVVAEGLTERDPAPDEREFIDWRYVPVEAALEAATTAPTTGWTLTPLLLARERGYI